MSRNIKGRRSTSSLMRYRRLQEEKNTKRLKEDIQKLRAILAAEMGSSCTAVCDRDGKRYTVTYTPRSKTHGGQGQPGGAEAGRNDFSNTL